MGVGRAGGLRPAVFLDRDGVINEPAWDAVDARYESPTHPRDVVLAEGAVDGLRTLIGAGWFTVVASNQPAAAKGKATLEDLHAVHARVVELLVAADIELDDWRYCFHHPEAVVPDLGGKCACRKPGPGLLLEAAAEHAIDLRASWMVGDSDADVRAGRRAGCRTVLVEHPRSAHRRVGYVKPDRFVRNLGCIGSFMVGTDPR